MTYERFAPGTRVLGALAVAFCISLAPGARALAQRAATRTRRASAAPAATTPDRFSAHDSVEVEYFVRGSWLPARVDSVLNDGYAYEVELAPYDDGRVIRVQIHYSAVRAPQPAPPAPAQTASARTASAESSGSVATASAPIVASPPPPPSAIPPREPAQVAVRVRAQGGDLAPP